jgi:hypothetical protein
MLHQGRKIGGGHRARIVLVGQPGITETAKVHSVDTVVNGK